MTNREAAVWISPHRLGGEPCLLGTRLSTALIAANRDHATHWWPVTPEQVEVACADGVVVFPPTALDQEP